MKNSEKHVTIKKGNESHIFNMREIKWAIKITRSPLMYFIYHSMNDKTQEELDSYIFELDNGNLNIINSKPDDYRLPCNEYHVKLDKLDSDWKNKNKEAFDTVRKYNINDIIEFAKKTEDPYLIAQCTYYMNNYIKNRLVKLDIYHKYLDIVDDKRTIWDEQCEKKLNNNYWIYFYLTD